MPIRRLDGETVFLEFTTTRIDLDDEPCVFCVGRDVTALVEATRKLEASERHYRSLVENVPDVIWSATTDWRYTFFSPNVLKVSGFTPDELLAGAQGGDSARVHPDDLDRVLAAREALSAHGTPMDLECRWQRRDGQWRWIHVRAVQTATGADGSYSDITAHKLMEEQLLQSQKIEVIGQLTTSIAHDFNNILAVIGINASIISDVHPPGDPDHEVARDLVEASRRGADLTRQLLAFSRRKPSAPTTVDLSTLLAGLDRMLVRLVGSRVELRMRGEKAARVHADAGQLEQVLVNLVVNARDAMETGTIDIDTSHVDVDDEAARAERCAPGPYVRLSVTDNGCGITEETQRRLFEPFFTTKAERGTGLGLATCLGIVRHSGGFISVKSELGRGTTFHVYLPRVAASKDGTSDCGGIRERD